MREKRWHVKTAPVRGYLLHLWEVRQERSGRWEAIADCRGANRHGLWPAFIPPEQSKIDAARHLLRQAEGSLGICKKCLGYAKREVERAEEAA